MRLFLASLFLLSCFGSSFAQDTSILESEDRNQTVYLELLGNGLVYSLNYDLRLEKGRQDGHGIRIGAGIMPVSERGFSGNEARGTVVTVPLAYNYLIGRRRSAFEVGAGLTPVFGHVAGVDVSGNEVDDADATVIGFLNAGYRYQPLNNGFVFRFTWTPAVTNEGFFPLWFGLSFGYGFK